MEKRDNTSRKRQKDTILFLNFFVGYILQELYLWLSKWIGKRNEGRNVKADAVMSG